MQTAIGLSERGTIMNREYANGIKKDILTQSLFCRLMACLIILLITYGCAGRPAIIKAAGSGDISTIKSLHAEGRNINEADSTGATALIYAIRSKKTDVAKYLIESGANVNVKDKDGFDALISAVDYNQIDLINILIDKGADIESRDYYGDTPLTHAALRKVNIDAVKMLVKRGANANTRNNKSQPLLDLLLDEPAAEMMEIVSLLVNADPKLLEPTKGKARLLFFGENFDRMGTVSVNVGNLVKYLSKINMLNLIDVEPGNHMIAIKISAAGSLVPRKQTKFSLDVKADQVYYFKILQREDFGAAGIIGSWVGQSSIGQVVSGIADQVEDPFKIGLIEESVAKAKIKGLLKTNN